MSISFPVDQFFLNICGRLSSKDLIIQGILIPGTLKIHYTTGTTAGWIP